MHMCSCAVILLCTILTGCETFPGDEDFYEITVAPEKLRQIETLALQKAEVEENDRTDANEPPPQNLCLILSNVGP